jgi:hypothetical protein
MPWRRLGERRYSSYSFFTSALDGDEWSESCPSHALAPGKGPAVPIVLEAGWVPEPVWTQRLEEKSTRLCQGLNLNRPVVQPVDRYCTDWATRLTWYLYFHPVNRHQHRPEVDVYRSKEGHFLPLPASTWRFLSTYCMGIGEFEKPYFGAASQSLIPKLTGWWWASAAHSQLDCMWAT